MAAPSWLLLATKHVGCCRGALMRRFLFRQLHSSANSCRPLTGRPQPWPPHPAPHTPAPHNLLSTTPALPQMVTASGDGLLKIWNIAVRYHMDEDPKVGSLVKAVGGSASTFAVYWVEI